MSTKTSTATSGAGVPGLAKFHAMTEGTAEDWGIIATRSIEFFMGLPERVLDHLRLLGGDFGGFPVDRLTHSLQTATRAYRADRDDEYIFCALVHDIGDTLGPANHADIAAAIVKPFVSEQNHFLVANHAVFQGYYFFHFLGLDRDAREQYRDHKWFDYTAEFCSEYDQPAFDPGYDTLPLEHFEPLVRSQLATARRSIYRPRDGAQRALAVPEPSATGS
ncbi:MAG: HD domain-containing protein [Acidimicrobiales bacterium]